MRLNVAIASLFACSLAFATPAFAQSTHSTTSSSTSAASGTNSTGNTSQHPQEFKTEAEAKSSCGTQPVVWANTSSHVLHAAGSKYFGKTKHGAYMCENTATQSGYHMAKNGQ